MEFVSEEQAERARIMLALITLGISRETASAVAPALPSSVGWDLVMQILDRMERIHDERNADLDMIEKG